MHTLRISFNLHSNKHIQRAKWQNGKNDNGFIKRLNSVHCLVGNVVLISEDDPLRGDRQIANSILHRTMIESRQMLILAGLITCKPNSFHF